MSYFQRLSFLIMLMALTVPALCLDWQGTGRQSNMTEIQTAVNKNPITSSTTVEQTETITQTISTRLDTLWNPASYMIIVKGSTGFDTIVYGYAFRNCPN